VTLTEVRAVLSGAFKLVLGAQRTGRQVEELAIYVADLTEPLGFTLARAIHAAKRGPDPAAFFRPSPRHARPRAPFIVGLKDRDELAKIAATAGESFESATTELHAAPRLHHVRILIVALGEVEVMHLSDPNRDPRAWVKAS
jgi:hypothetical protein